MYARPSLAGRTLDFGVSGKLWRHALVLYDRQTATLWSQRSHRAIAGPHAGAELEVIASQITDWRSWKDAHPASTVLVKPGDGEEWTAVLVSAGLVAVLAFVLLRRRSAEQPY